MTPHLLLSMGIAVALSVLGGCASSGSAKGEGGLYEPEEPEAISRFDSQDDRAVGYLLAGLSSSIEKWNALVLTGSDVQDGQRIRTLESAIRHQSRQHLDDLVEQVTTGPPRNRQIAATALGFSESPDALAPLLAALLDTDQDVVANALLGLSILGHPQTPLGNIASLLTDPRQPASVRANAGRALRNLGVSRRGEEERIQVRDAARAGIADVDASVVMNSVLLLAELQDADSIPTIAEQLQHPSPTVARAAARGLAYMGSAEPTSKGPAVRALVGSLPRVDGRSVRPALLVDLQRLAGRNYGDDLDAWLKYANSLP